MTRSLLSASLTRRGALAGFAATSALAALPLRARAQEEVTLRWWSPQGAPAQLEAYQAQIAAFEAANPGIRVVFEATSDEGYAPQLAAAFSSGEVPDIVTHLPSFAAQSYYDAGLRRALRRRHRGDRRGRSTSPARTTSSGRPTATTSAPASATPPPTCCGCAPT